LRAGALPAPIDYVEERIIGPSMGIENIEKGMISLLVGLSLIMIFMVLYYRVFGFIANLGLVFNLVMLLAILSLIGATLTLPSIAAIVLTLGMAVDANVLIFERIREELRMGQSVQASINAGFNRAFVTILDANITTFIAALALFAIGSGPIKGFALALILGLVTSVFTAVSVTRLMVNAAFGGRTLKKLPIGM
jgi:preprotein translocase subunit SecD